MSFISQSLKKKPINVAQYNRKIYSTRATFLQLILVKP